MKRIQKTMLVVLLLGAAALTLTYCTKDNQNLDLPQPVNSGTDLVAMKVAAPPAMDGVVDALWETAPKLQFSTSVPEVTGDIYRGYTGNIIPSVTLRSVYDATHIYILAEWSDPTQSLTRSPWYFDPVTKKWMQESANFTFSSTGAVTRLPFYEDKVAFLWNVDNSVQGWNSGTCYKSCHGGLPAIDGSTRHYTNFPTERIDMWHWKSVRGGVNGPFLVDDQFIYYTYPNGRKGDDGNDVYANNSQNLGGVTVPKYIIPNRNNYGWILQSEIDANTAVTVTAVDAEGVLTLSNGSTINPAVGTDYQRIGAGVGPKAIPGVTINTYTGNRADISCKASYTGSGWILEIKRALKTGDTQRQDVDFSSLADQYFGFAIFENSQIAHSIKPNLVLKFKK